MYTVIIPFIIIVWGAFVASITFLVISNMNMNRNKRAVNYLTLYLEKNPSDVTALEDYKRSCKRLIDIFERAIIGKYAKTAGLYTIKEIFRKALLQKMEHEGKLP